MFAAEKAKKKASDITIPVIYLDVSINFAQPIKAGVEQAGKDLGVKTIFDGSVNFNIDQQVAIIENYITRKVDGMAIAPLSSEVIDPLINKAIDAGIPVVTFNTDSPTSNRIAFFGQDLVTVAREQGELIANLINKKGTVLITSCDAAAPWSQMREQGVREGLAKFPNIKVIENICNAKGDEQTTYAAIENAMLANRGVTAVASLDAITTPAVGRYILRNGLSGKIIQVGHDLMPETLDNIKAGATTATLSQDPYTQGYAPVKALVEHLTKGTPLKDLNTGKVVVDKKNVEGYIKRLEQGDKTVG
jgi:simple sugar transport system substrate-binding protein/ribose transport system substrate-binding protein